MIQVDATKLVVAVTVIAAVTVLLALGRIDDVAGVPIISTVVGYILGNGRSVAAGDRPGTLLTRSDVRSRADDRTDVPPNGRSV